MHTYNMHNNMYLNYNINSGKVRGPIFIILSLQFTQCNISATLKY